MYSMFNSVVTEKVMMVTEVPFLFTGTIRENMDPNGLKTDQ
jgi:ABC-type bacteriocin/lantibiotic exporter with double-glycine peptidase domain